MGTNKEHLEAKREYDIPTYPNFGNIYKGDYYEEIPFAEYINPMPLPKGSHVFDIREFGAAPEKDRMNTEAFQKASNACKEAGGGTILVQGGEYTMGSVYLYDNTTLHIASDSAITASRDVTKHSGGFLTAEKVENITITGGGKIKGNGEWFVYEPKQKPLLKPLEVSYLPPRNAVDINGVEGTTRYHYRQRIRYAEDKYGESLPHIPRPGFLVWIKKCLNVKIENIILENSMAWTLNLDTSDKVLIHNTIINNNRHVANTDGIDITGSNEVEVKHCFISTADDGIVIKNPLHTNRPMTHIRIKNCTVLSVMNAFKIGTETAYDISDIVVEDCNFCLPDIYPGTVSGISIESADGSQISDVTVRNITMDKVTCPLFICLNMRNRHQFAYSDDENALCWGGGIKNISIENVTAQEAEQPSLITGFINSRKDGSIVRKPVTDIKITNFKVTYRNNKEIVEVPEVIEEYLTRYPENNNFGDVDAYGIWVRHADGITLDNISIIPRDSNKRECVKLYDVRS